MGLKVDKWGGFSEEESKKKEEKTKEKGKGGEKKSF